VKTQTSTLLLTFSVTDAIPLWPSSFIEIEFPINTGLFAYNDLISGGTE